MADWSMEELQSWDNKICTLGEGLGLDWYPIEYEICDYKEMIGHMENHLIESRQNIIWV